MYLYTNPPPHTHYHPPYPDSSTGMTFSVSCPKEMSYCCISFLRAYTVALGLIGLLLSMVWVLGHSYVLHITLDDGLKLQRLVDILLLAFLTLISIIHHVSSLMLM